ncbi:SGNH/GDSL hydrolase family protein [uncultured Dubosiella sp.]|uniref:SGNH/GDSL hydrolase family protein n=1 Tax=uncultured Dubosiella sp. TaxID=1937011 RepID=UPI0025B429D0|nr:SGNH/GDSL hydrolase family protein [uncultured Dubosiella sp.]
MKKKWKRILRALPLRGKVALLGGFAFFVFLIGFFAFKILQPETPGRIYIQKQTQLKPENMAEALQERKKKELQTMMDSGAIDVIAAFDDYALFGDSRAYGLKSYGVLDPDFVYAEAGHTILNCTDYKDVIQQTRPARLVFSYGVNDMGLEIGGDGDHAYAQTFEQKIDELLAVVPDAKVFVCSIIDVTPSAKERSPRWDKAARYNAQLQEMCQRRGWIYVDNDPLGNDLSSYQEDGVHFTPDFTWTWARNIAKTMWETVFASE